MLLKFIDNDIEDTEEAIDDVREITPEFMVTPPKAMKDVSTASLSKRLW